MFSCSGGGGMISKLVTDKAPCRIDVPMQSDPVSPPPMTMTFLPFAENRFDVALRLVTHAPVLLRQKIHREMDSGKLAARNRQVARLLAAASQHDGVMLLEQFVDRDIDADIGIVVEDDTFALHLLDATVDVDLLHLEIGDAVTEQAARFRPTLVDMHLVACARELLCTGETRRS